MDVFSKEKQPWERRVVLTRKVDVATVELLGLSRPHHNALSALHIYVQRGKKIHIHEKLENTTFCEVGIIVE